ncbi:MAG: MATE family efflux transporter [Candidatus Cyclonatronum sp.]|uniref:MATE family efflux transporter n=1 Tax=Cyclonatronum sp. TaxID=3024185 RepID=UPI0025C2F4A4|nr:MATE family efflux transporter [Cyclonatronum sp.]MCH8485260.1 MATE family efflux transporter [Cyclonatronum sp.]
MNRQILRLAIPNIISNLSVPLLSSVDTALVGRLDGVYYLGALAIGGMIFNFLYWGFGFLRMGTTGLTATAYGGKNDAEVSVVLSRAMLAALLGSSLLIVSQYLLFSGAMLVVSTSEEVREMAALYFYIRIWDAPAVLALFAIQGWFLGMQNARFPMYITIFINLLNIGLNIFFIYGLGMTVDGVAYGTVIAQYLGLFFALWLFFRHYGRGYIHLGRKALLAVEGLKRFFSVSRDIFIRTMSLIFTYSFFTIQSAALGDEILAVNLILMQLWYIMAYGVDGFAYAAESITGKYAGRGDRAGLTQAVKLLVAWGMGLGAAFSLIYYLFDASLLRIFTDNPELIALGLTFFAWTVAAPLINSFCFMLDGIYIGATVTGPMRDSMLISTFLVFLPAYYLSVGSIGNHALWLAMTAYMIARGATLLWFLPGKVLGRVG